MVSSSRRKYRMYDITIIFNPNIDFLLTGADLSPVKNVPHFKTQQNNLEENKTNSNNIRKKEEERT